MATSVCSSKLNYTGPNKLQFAFINYECIYFKELFLGHRISLPADVALSTDGNVHPRHSRELRGSESACAKQSAPDTSS